MLQSWQSAMLYNVMSSTRVIDIVTARRPIPIRALPPAGAGSTASATAHTSQAAPVSKESKNSMLSSIVELGFSEQHARSACEATQWVGVEAALSALKKKHMKDLTGTHPTHSCSTNSHPSDPCSATQTHSPGHCLVWLCFPHPTA